MIKTISATIITLNKNLKIANLNFFLTKNVVFYFLDNLTFDLTVSSSNPANLY